LPVIVDPSQGTGLRELVVPMSMAALLAGADGVMVEVHNQPEEALSDGDQSLYFDQFNDLVTKLIRTAKVLDKNLDLESEKILI
jgi:3-deoxy-7-phosphoheptulonate synthase